MVWAGEVAGVVNMTDLIGALWGPLGGVLAAALGVLGLWIKTAMDKRSARREGAEQQRAKDAIETAKRFQRGQEAINRGRASGDSPADRLRRNDGKW